MCARVIAPPTPPHAERTRRHKSQSPTSALIKATSLRPRPHLLWEGRSHPASHHPHSGHTSSAARWLLPPPPATRATTCTSSSFPSPSSSPRSSQPHPPVGDVLHLAACISRARRALCPFPFAIFLERLDFPDHWFCREWIRWAAGARRRRPAQGDSQGRDRAEAQGAGQGQAAHRFLNIQLLIRFSSSRCRVSR